MRLCLVLAIGLLPGCLSVRSVLIDGQEVQTTYLGPIRLNQSTHPAVPAVDFDDDGNVIGVATPAGIVPLGVEFDFGNAKWIAEEITVTSETTSLPYGNGEVIGVELGDHESMKLIRIAMKGEDGSLQVVNYDFVPNAGLLSVSTSASTHAKPRRMIVGMKREASE